MKLKFCGAAGTVTGSSHLLTLDDGYQILLDCGLYQGRDEDMDTFNQEWMFDPTELDCLILSHAHIDHSGRIPKLVKDGFRGRIYSTHATRDLCSIMLMDSAKIQVKDAEWENRRRAKRGQGGEVKPLYEAQDARRAMKQFAAFPYEERFNIHPDVDVLFKDAGHILGSASVTLKIRRQGLKDTVLGFSGDIGRPDRPILRDPVPIQACDYLICESTYGDKFHKARPAEEEQLLNIIKKTCCEQGGKLIIPAFSVGRTQEIVHLIDRLENDNKLPKKVKIFVDSPLAVDATDIFRMHPECFDKELMDYLYEDPDPFGFKNLHYIKKVEDSKRLNNVDSAIIISASGMITAGRIKHHVYNSVEKAKNTILIVGYCAPYTIGAQLASGAKRIRIFGDHLDVNANVEIMNSFSAHGDQREMIDFLENQNKDRLRKLFLVHGVPKRQVGFKEALESEGFENVLIPELGESFRI
jgi:metallo-beta-lactamase family protein